DHALWHVDFGSAPRYGTERCVAALRDELVNPDAKAAIREHLAETEIAGQVPLDLYGQITALPSGSTEVPWSGMRVRNLEQRGHPPGHGALRSEGAGVPVAGDMLSDSLIPFLDLEAAEPVEDYLAALRRFEGVLDGVAVVVPGHGSVATGAAVR